MVSSRGAFVLKLPRERVASLVAAGQGQAFDPGHGRVMKEWVRVDRRARPRRLARAGRRGFGLGRRPDALSLGPQTRQSHHNGWATWSLAMLTRRSHLVALSALALPTASRAFSLSEGDAAGGVRAALERGALAAVAQLGRNGGFLDHPSCASRCPVRWKSRQKLLKATGQGKRVDRLITAMNRAAEQAVPAGRRCWSNGQTAQRRRRAAAGARPGR